MSPTLIPFSFSIVLEGLPRSVILSDSELGHGLDPVDRQLVNFPHTLYP